MLKSVVDLLIVWKNRFGKRSFFCLEANPFMIVVDIVEREESSG